MTKPCAVKYISGVVLCLLAVNVRAQSVPRLLSDTTLGYATYFLLRDEQGKTVDVATLKGKVLFLNFWALSCAPCKAEMPTINSLHDHFRNDTNVLICLIDLDSDHEHSPAYMREHGYGLTVYNTASVVPENFFHGKLPTTLVIDKTGRVVYYRDEEGDYGSKEFVAFMEVVVDLRKSLRRK
jgi:thiol-disulfide isomerase/thioredoxin